MVDRGAVQLLFWGIFLGGAEITEEPRSDNSSPSKTKFQTECEDGTQKQNEDNVIRQRDIETRALS
jgi:hypothetical protein